MGHQVMLFGTFLAISAMFHAAQRKFEGREHLVLATALFAHPITLDAARDWVVHLIVYSGHFF